MNWLKSRVNWTAFSYSLHLIVSMLIVIGCVKLGLAPHKAVIISIGLGILKEILDEIWRNGADKNDILYNAIGIVIGFVLTMGYYK